MRYKEYLLDILTFFKADHYSIMDIARATGINHNSLYYIKRTGSVTEEMSYIIIKKIKEAFPEEYWRVIGLMLEYKDSCRDDYTLMELYDE